MLTGCAATVPPSLHGPDYFHETTQPDVVLGYFTKPHQLGVMGCLDYARTMEPEDPALGHCLGPNPSVTLVVGDVIFGHLEQSRWELTVTDSHEHPRMPIGPRHRVLAYPSRYGTLDATSYIELARTERGEWAVPFSSEYDEPQLPCMSANLLELHPISFARPYPRRALDEYEPDEIEKLRKNPHVTVRSGFVEFHAGVLLSEIYAVRERIPTLDARDKWLVDACLRK
ncbi:MAG TPA: hypothetical protein VM146_09200 [Steroidobacteraceae bacterium]|nr:hypothetical protein [Steroidobacteraceae bacterium]